MAGSGLTLQGWVAITLLGDSAVLMPAVALMLAWLVVVGPGWRHALRWLLLLVGVATTVVLTKLLFMAWGVGVAAWDFTGLSGHSSMAAAVLPSLLALFAGGHARGWRAAAVIVGLVLAVAIGVSRVQLHAHSVSEVVLGLGVGAAAALAFLAWMGEGWRLSGPVWLVALLLMLTVWLIYGDHFPSERVIRWVAQLLRHGALPYTRGMFHPHGS